MGKKQMVEIGKTELRKLQKKIEAQEKKRAKKAERNFDGFGPFLIMRSRQVLRELWQRSSQARKIVVKRCELAGGYSRCELCKKKVPKVFIDHIERVGDLDAGFFKRLFCSSKGLQGLCEKCHSRKTAQERKAQKEALKNF